jgi:RecA-family ATPase
MKTNLKLLTLEEIQAEAVQWLWEPYIALGKITLVQGDGGIGKSTMARAIAAAVTRGEEVGGTGVYAPPASVIYQSAEDGYADVVKPQLLKLGADCSRVRVIDESECSLTLYDERIEQAIVKTNAKLFILDPLQAYLGGSDMRVLTNSASLRRLGAFGGIHSASLLVLFLANPLCWALLGFRRFAAGRALSSHPKSPRNQA